MRVFLPLLLVAIAACGGSDAADEPSATEPADVATTPANTSTSAPEAPEPDVPSSDAPPVETDPPATTTAAPPTEQPAEQPEQQSEQPGTAGAELVGRWAHYDVVAYEDGTLKTLIISYGFNDFTEVDGQIIDAASFCFSEQRTDQPVKTSLSDAATQAIMPPSTPVEIDTVAGTLRMRRAATPTPVGIVLDDPANEPLPTDPDDPRIVDADGDGKPGITVTIEVSPELVGELYIARREIFAYEAFLTDPDTLEGSVTDDSEQLVIGVSDPIFAGSGSDWAQFPDPARNPIILRRVDADWDCARLAAERDALFPPTPDVDW